MGRPRKQPRRIMTFNLNLPLAEAIDNLPVKNRSEWANKALQEVLDNRVDTSRKAVDAVKDAARDEGQADLLRNLEADPRRLAIMLANSLQSNGLETYKPKGRYTLYELLVKAIKDDSGGSLMGNFPSSRGDAR